MNIHAPEVLLVEDNVDLASTTMLMLTEFGFRPRHAASVEEAYAVLASACHVDAILLDLELGEDRGESVIRRLRELHTPLPALVILSGQPRPELSAEARETGAATALHKPCGARQIADSLFEALRIHDSGSVLA